MTEDGKVWSHKRKRFLCQHSDSKGYQVVQLGTRLYMVHRVVAWTYLPEPPSDLYQINHKDGNKSNNHVSNIEWCTGSENMVHAWKTGLVKMTPAMVNQRRANAAKMRKTLPPRSD